ncbi:hypothetical protein CR513_16395, partial [Mucuna pruriens]
MGNIFVHQTKYIQELLKKFKLDDCKVMNTLMHPTLVLILDYQDKKVDKIAYKGMIGLLIYLIASKLYIMFNVYLCARFQLDQRETHHIAVKGLFQYLKGCHFIEENLISLTNKRQSIIALSTTRIEYISTKICYSSCYRLDINNKTTTFSRLKFLYSMIIMLQLIGLKNLFFI